MAACRGRWLLGSVLVCHPELLLSWSGFSILGLATCGRDGVSHPKPHDPALSETTAYPVLRDVRVLIGSAVERVKVRTGGPTVIVGTRQGPASPLAGGAEMVFSAAPSTGLRLGAQPLGAADVTLRPEPGASTWVSSFRDGAWSTEGQYPGLIRLRSADDGAIDVTNLVDVEEYVACVVAGEVWPTFHTEAFRVQAIVARTFVLYQMHRRQSAEFDVAATQAAQVYRGIVTDATGRRAVESCRYTRGIVCTWHDGSEDRLFCTYYNAACGGMSQSAAIFGPESEAPPLSGAVSCDYCRIAPGAAYRWGPIRLSQQELLQRLTGRYPQLASLGRIVELEPLERTPDGRMVRLRIVGLGGAHHDMSAEQFRLAIGANLIRSTDCRIRVEGAEVVFEEGRGFGHGLGLCQWGAQGQALQGKSAAEILRYYYPGSKLTRAF